jgi:SAM-dependent methyltransferase
MSELRKSGTEVLAECVALKGARVIDVGSGDGAMARFMTKAGAHVTGIECGQMQIEKARAAEPEGDERYLEGVGQNLPLGDSCADIVTFLNSLHHVPVPDQGKALKEAARVLVDGGALYIAEPLAEGPQFTIVQPVDDETEVRAAAYEEIKRAGVYGFEAVSEIRFTAWRKVERFEALRDTVISIDPTRREAVMALEPKLRESFERLAEKQADGTYLLSQPMRVNLFRRQMR